MSDLFSLASDLFPYKLLLFPYNCCLFSYTQFFPRKYPQTKCVGANSFCFRFAANDEYVYKVVRLFPFVLIYSPCRVIYSLWQVFYSPTTTVYSPSPTFFHFEIMERSAWGQISFVFASLLMSWIYIKLCGYSHSF